MGNAPHMSYNKIKLRNEIKVNDEHGVPNEFRASGYIQFKTDWNDTLGRPQPMTEAQQKICDDLADKLPSRPVTSMTTFFFSASDSIIVGGSKVIFLCAATCSNALCSATGVPWQSQVA